MSKYAIIRATERIQKNGTLIVSFRHGDKFYKNVTLGSNRAADYFFERGGMVNKMLVKTCGDLYLFGISNNEDHSLKAWKISEITAFSAAYEQDSNPSLWFKFKFWLNYLVSPLKLYKV